MPTTIDQLPDAQKLDLFRAMVQTGAIVAACVLRPENGDPVNKAMEAVEMAARITLDELEAAGSTPAASSSSSVILAAISTASMALLTGSPFSGLSTQAATIAPVCTMARNRSSFWASGSWSIVVGIRRV